MSEDASAPHPGPEAASDPSDATPLPFVPWPPPGLERLQGDLWQVIEGLARGGVIFVTPLLAGLTLPQDPWRLGVYGSAWWVVLLTSTLAVILLMAGYVQLFRVLRRWREATRCGYRVRTVALVLVDRTRDTGFLVQGVRAYSVIDRDGRGRLLGGRLAQGGLSVAGALWLSAGFIVGVLMATRGALGAAGLVAWTLLPPALVLATVVVLRAWEGGVLRHARRKWHAKPWIEDLARDEIAAWHLAVAARPTAVAIPEGPAEAGSGALRGAAAATALVGVAILLLGAPLVTTSGIGPLLASIALPNLSTTGTRAARTEALTTLRLPVDPSITPLQAGEALHSLTAEADAGGLVKAPVRSNGPVFPDGEYDDNPTGLAPHLWARDLVPRLAGGLDPATSRYLRGLGEHPALRELGLLAHAATIDEIGARHVLPFSEDMSPWDLPIPRYSRVRELAYAQVGAAVGAAAAGRVAEADQRVRELIGAGMLLGREGSTLISNLVGYTMAGVGADALANLYAVTGRAAAGEAFRERMRLTEQAALLARAGLGSTEISQMPDVVTDTTALRGMRWEYLITLSTLGPCLNLRRAVFGAPEGHQAWLEEARASLVRTRGEGELFRLAERGWAVPEAGSSGPVARLFAQIMGRGLGSCAQLAAAATR